MSATAGLLLDCLLGQMWEALVRAEEQLARQSHPVIVKASVTVSVTWLSVTLWALAMLADRRSHWSLISLRSVPLRSVPRASRSPPLAPVARSPQLAPVAKSPQLQVCGQNHDQCRSRARNPEPDTSPL